MTKRGVDFLKNRFSKKLVISPFFGVMLVLLAVFVWAAAALGSPIQYGNYSSSMNVSVSGLVNGLNVSLYYNASGGFVNTSDTAFLVITNTSASATVIENASVVTSSLSDSGIYNFTFLAANSSTTSTLYVANVTIDNTAPNATFVSPAFHLNSTGGNNVFNVTVADSLVGASYAFINITNSSGQIVVLNLTNIGSAWNATFNLSTLADGYYNATIYANDSLNNLNSTVVLPFDVDNTAPVADLYLSSAGSTSLTFTSTCGDSTSGVLSCVLTSSAGTVSGSVVSGLSCSSSYEVTLTATDYVGLTNANTTSYSTGSCGGGSSGSGGGGGGDSWTNTFVDDDKELSEKGNLLHDFREKYRARIKVNGEEHHVGVLSLTSDSVTVQVSSDPVQASLSVGESEKFEVDNDDFYDLEVSLLSISGGVAQMQISAIHEAVVSTGSTGTQSTGSTGSQASSGAASSAGSSTWVWVVVVIVILAVIVGVAYYMKKRK